MALFILFLNSIWLLVLRPVSASVTSGIALNEFIRHFEPLFYDHHNVRLQHSRSKRESQSQLQLQFHAHNRLFKIRLRRSASVFADDVVLESTAGSIAFDMDKVYQGELEDDDHSTVSAVLTSSGLLDATVSTASETYYVEPASRYFDASRNLSFPAVIYKASDVLHPDPHHHGSGCASHQLYLKQFEHFHCANKQENRDGPRNSSDLASVLTSCQESNTNNKGGVSEGIEPNQLIDQTLYSGWNRRHNEKKKKKRRSTIDHRKTTCMLYLQADHLFYGKMGSEEACIETMTRHVQRVNSIYKNVDFDGDGQGDDINFMIKRIKVHTEQALNEASYRFPGNYGVEKFLELFSEEDYNAFCLAYMFTYRDFEGGTLGLAWTGDLKNAGGVCEKNGHYRGSLKSLNTGIVTLLNYGKHVPPAVSHVTLAHEIGHNFGSPHDPENNRDCTPGGEDGNYIMFARATSGDKRNNNKFSPCSLKSINGVLSAKARNEQGCFKEPQSAICGNGVVEAGEECDCGWEEDCQEKCCFPMRSIAQHGEKPCTLRPATTCSPSQGPCCTESCQLRYGVKCRDDNGCRDSAFCDGSGPKCPPSNNKANKTVCNEEFVCFMGECTGSICIAYGLQSCQCLQGANDPPTKACELCCKLPGDDQPCLSSFEWNTPPYDVPSAHAKAGTPCNNYNGYCDVFQRCREVDPSGPLATLRRLLLSDESIASLKKWIEDHWYGVLFIAVGFITIIAVVARVFGKRVERKKRQRTQQRASRTTNGVTTAAAAAATAAAVDENQGQHIVHPVAVRSAIPLKRKVREKEKRAGRKAYSTASALAVFRKARKPQREERRQRRSGIVNTKDKVRSWLERENPTRETIDSDNESHFPEEEINPSANQMRRTSKSSTSLNQQTPDSSNPSCNRRSSSSEFLSLSPPSLDMKPPVKKMMRSISENPRHFEVTPIATANGGRHNFSRSISHGHEPDFSRLGRKTESHSHLLSKSELDLEPLGDSSVNNKPKESAVCHPPVQKRIPNPKIPKSSTEGQLKASKPKPKTKTFSSFEFLNLLTGSKSTPVEKSGKPTRAARGAGERTGSPAKIRKKIGLGPVKVVLKWHGAGRASRVKPPAQASAGKSKMEGEKRNNNKKKRVIVYKNGDPIANVATGFSKERKQQPVEQQTKTSSQSKLNEIETANEIGSNSSGKDAINIIANPLPESAAEQPSRPSAEAIFRSRRYSMQERLSQPPPLVRRVSEIHTSTSGGAGQQQQHNNSRRNRHSWTVGTLPEFPLNSEEIGIDIEHDC